jgi:hypothetical protein
MRSSNAAGKEDVRIRSLEIAPEVMEITPCRVYSPITGRRDVADKDAVLRPVSVKRTTSVSPVVLSVTVTKTVPSLVRSTSWSIFVTWINTGSPWWNVVVGTSGTAFVRSKGVVLPTRVGGGRLTNEEEALDGRYAPGATLVGVPLLL